jgi:hypothetical protein
MLVIISLFETTVSYQEFDEDSNISLAPFRCIVVAADASYGHDCIATSYRRVESIDYRICKNCYLISPVHGPTNRLPKEGKNGYGYTGRTNAL